MKHRLLAASFAAVLVIASGVAGSFYFAGAQAQVQSDEREQQISLDIAGTIEPGTTSTISGSRFDDNIEVSIYLMSAVPANMTDSSWVILQQSENQTSAEQEDASDGNLVNDALDALRGLLGMQQGEVASEQNATGRLLIVPEGAIANGTVTIECDDQEVASGDIESDTAFMSLSAVAGSYSECNLTVSDGNGIVDSAELGALEISPDADEEYEDSIVASAQTDDDGSFSTSFSVSESSAGQYAILAVADDGRQTAVSNVFTIEAATETNEQADSAGNDTADMPVTVPPLANETLTEEDQGAATTNDTGEAQVQVDEEQVEAGSPLAIQGDGFEPNTPVQIFINNLQITNIITNVQGSFNTVVIVPTVVNSGNAEVVVKTEQTNIVRNVDVVQEDPENRGPAFIRFNSVSDNERLQGAPVTIFDAKTGQLVESDKTPFQIELEKGKYSVFFSDFRNFDFQSGEPGTWIDTPGGGSGLLTVREGRNATVTATYEEIPSPPPPPEPATSTLVLRAQDTDGNALEGMFVSVYNAEEGDRIEQGFTELRIEDLAAGTYPIFFANFGEMTFVSATPGSWVQTPYGGAGLATIPDDGESHEIVVTATFDRVTTVVEDVFEIQAPLDIRGHVFSITSNQTRPEGPFEISGSMTLRVESEDPVTASLTAYLMSAREDSNENVNLESQRSRDHDTFQIVDFKPRAAAPTGPNSYIVTGTADLLLNGDMYSNDEEVQVTVRGGE
jgi:hypothetical protein